MTWELFYLMCFVLGLTLTVLASLGAFSHLHFGHFHVHLGHAGHIGHAAHAAGKSGIGPVNGFTIAAFLCWFGGCGYLLVRFGDLLGALVLALAVVAGLAGGGLLFWFLSRVLMAHESTLTADDTEMQGVLGYVSSEIRPEGVGEIQFSQNGARRFAPARSEEGVAISREVEVVVMRYERGIAYVRRWDDVAPEWPEWPEKPEWPKKKETPANPAALPQDLS